MSRPRNNRLHEQEFFSFAYDHASLTASTTVKLLTAQRRMRIDKVEYVNPTGLATDVTNFFDVQLVDDPDGDGTVVANWSTETGQEGTLTADTFVELVKSATDSELVIEKGRELAAAFVEGGTATLPAGRMVVHGRYV